MKKRLFLLFAALAAVVFTACGATAETQQPEPEQISVAAEEEPAPLVTELQLAGQPESALAQLADCPELKTLDISGMTLTSVEPLKGCTALKTLNACDTGLTPAMYEELRAALPECEIYWSVPVGGEYFDCTAESVTVPAEGGADLENLDYLPNLTAVDLTAVPEDELTYAFTLAHPELAVTRTVEICGTRYESTAAQFDLTAAEVTDPAALGGLVYLDSAAVVDLRGTERTLEEMESFTAAYPDCSFLFSFRLDDLGIKDFPVDGGMTELDISNRRVKDLELLRRYLNLLPNLTELVMCDCGPSDEEMALLREDYPTVKVVWMLHIRNYYSLRTDAVAFSTLCKKNEDYPYLTTKNVQVFRYCTDLLALDLGHHSITDISFLEDLPQLRVLILALNNITDFSPLTNCPNLTYLEIFGNVNTDSLAPIGQLVYLKDLNISYNELATDYECLYGLTSLERLWMARMPATEEELAALQAALPDCTIVCEKWGFAVGDKWRVHPRYDALSPMFKSGIYDPIFEPDPEPAEAGGEAGETAASEATAPEGGTEEAPASDSTEAEG